MLPICLPHAYPVLTPSPAPLDVDEAAAVRRALFCLGKFGAEIRSRAREEKQASVVCRPFVLYCSHFVALLRCSIGDCRGLAHSWDGWFATGSRQLHVGLLAMWGGNHFPSRRIRYFTFPGRCAEHLPSALARHPLSRPSDWIQRNRHRQRDEPNRSGVRHPCSQYFDSYDQLLLSAGRDAASHRRAAGRCVELACSLLTSLPSRYFTFLCVRESCPSRHVYCQMYRHVNRLSCVSSVRRLVMCIAVCIDTSPVKYG